MYGANPGRGRSSISQSSKQDDVYARHHVFPFQGQRALLAFAGQSHLVCFHQGGGLAHLHRRAADCLAVIQRRAAVAIDSPLAGLLADHQLPALGIQVHIQRVISRGYVQVADRDIAIGVQRGGVVRARSPDGVVRLQRAGAAENLSALYRWRRILDRDRLAADCGGGLLRRAGLAKGGARYDGERQNTADCAIHLHIVRSLFCEYITPCAPPRFWSMLKTCSPSNSYAILLGLIGIGSAFMAGQTLAAVRQGQIKARRHYAWMARAAGLPRPALAFRHQSGLADHARPLALAASPLSPADGGMASHQKPPEDLSHDIVPHDR